MLSVTALTLVRYHNGDQWQALNVTFRCRTVSGEARVNDDESIDVGWFPLDELPPDLLDRHREAIHDALAADSAARFMT